MSCTARDPVFPGIILSRSCLFMISRETFAGGKYVLDTLITGGMRVLQSFCTGSFKLFRTVPVRELQESHTRPVSLLFHPAGGKYAVYDPIGCCTDRFRPLAEAVPVPFKILLVALGHMLRDRRILRNLGESQDPDRYAQTLRNPRNRPHGHHRDRQRKRGCIRLIASNL